MRRVGPALLLLLACSKSSSAPAPEPTAEPTAEPAADRGSAAAQVAPGAAITLSCGDSRSPLRKPLCAPDALPDLVASIEDEVVLPSAIEVVLTGCEEPNALYDPQTAQVILCDELLDGIADAMRAEEPDRAAATRAAVGAVAFIALHELGHALVHLLDLPIVGREEDAVDQLATLALLWDEARDGVEMAVDGAMALLALDEQEDDGGEIPFWDEHSLGPQRVYNVLCLIYGSDPDQFAPMVGADMLPAERAEICPEEYDQVSSGWLRLLEPHLRPGR